MPTIRKAALADLDFLIRADLSSDGYTDTTQAMTDAEAQAHRAKLAAFVQDAAHKGAWVCEETERHELVGMILCRYRQWPPQNADEYPANSVFYELPQDVFPADGRFCEIFQLWVDPRLRRQGIATRLKEQVEHEARQRGIEMIYTHTEAQNTHVIALNEKLGYREVRRGPIWDEVVRVSLVKGLGR